MRPASRFPVKLAGVALLLLSVAGVSSVLIALRLFDRRQIEIDQRLNAGIAASMAAELEPVIGAARDRGAGTGDGTDDGAIGAVMHYMMVMNPAVEIYLLDDTGRILDFFASPGAPVQLERVSVEPIRRFLEGADLPILGDNPRRPAERHHFSAAPVDLGNGTAGYLYVILRSTEYDAAAMALQQRYLFRALRTALLVTIPLVGLVGLAVFLIATRPLERLTATVRAFGAGDHSVRAAVDSGDEVGDLARNFNWMADTIVADVSRLEHADRERRELIANISHDLRNPLATVQGYLETLSQKDADLSAADRRRYYEILIGATRSLPRLVQDLFELSRLDAPDAEPPTERCSLAELVQDVAVQWRSRAEDQGIELVVPQPGNLHLVEANIGLIERVLTNLLRNAVAHTPAGGTITLALAEAGGGGTAGGDGDAGGAVRVSVRDTGPGIPESDRERVFERFFIGDESRSRSRDGSGLGLAICRRIVELHHGTIGVAAAPNGGAEFWFTLPA